MKKIYLIYAILATGAPWNQAQAPPLEGSGATSLMLTYLANEGFLLRSGSHGILIDAFVKEPYSEYASLSAETWEHMLSARAPFENIDLALVSHRHRDHFQADAAMAFLSKHPETTLVSSPDVVNELALQDGYEKVKQRVKVLLPEPGETIRSRESGIQVDFLRIAHGGRWRDLHNLGHVIHLSGLKILHVGDADVHPSHFEPYAGQLEDLDIALVPYWYYLSSKGRELVKGVFKARFEVAVHLSLKDWDEILKEFSNQFPKVILFEEELTAKSFQPK